jgi:hypothetical protein
MCKKSTLPFFAEKLANNADHNCAPWTSIQASILGSQIFGYFQQLSVQNWHFGKNQCYGGVTKFICTNIVPTFLLLLRQMLVTSILSCDINTVTVKVQ